MLRIIFILLSIHVIISGDEHCKRYNCDEDGCSSQCLECDYGYYLEKGHCYKNLCVEGENEDSCLKCSIENGICLSCYSDDYRVYNRYQCKKSNLTCGNNTIQHCQSCDTNLTDNCSQCYEGYLLENNECHYIVRINKKGEIIRQNKLLLCLIVIFIIMLN